MKGTKVIFKKNASGKIVSVPDKRGKWSVINVKDLPKPDINHFKDGIDPYDPTK